MSNMLKNEKSPYLRQHSENPVNWYPWCDKAFRRARDENKPVFLSIGYSTCHWCHVMAHESFEDFDVAKLLNENFISIKVDREERPDIDSVYMTVCQALTGAGGWPLTIIMTPEQKPFFAGSYFPKRRSLGQPGLIDILEQTKLLWEEDREELQKTGEQITQAFNRSNESVLFENPDKGILKEAYNALKNSFDSVWGGFGAAPKFPSPHNLMFLLRYSHLENDSESLHMAEVTLNAMLRGGIHDQIGGGFCRYSTDRKWLVPHFEKMLYDNALLIILYLEAYQRTDNKSYLEVSRQTADYILRELTDIKGGFYCGQDADSDGIEGKYYVFTPNEIKDVLGDHDGAEFCRLYGITEGGNFEGRNIPNLIGTDNEAWRYDDPRMKKLYEYRKKRVFLHKDDKILLSWNSWTIIAMARAGQILGDEKYREAAENAQRFIEENMTDSNNRLYLRFSDGDAAYAAQLEDYAVYSLSLIELYSLTFNPYFLSQAVLRAKQMIEYFEDKNGGGYYISASDAERLIVRLKESFDGAVPSGNSVAAMVLEKLSILTGETIFREAADRQQKYMAGQMKRYPSAHCFALIAMSQSLYTRRELICVCHSEPTELKEYIRYHWTDDLNILLKTAENAEKLSESAPFTRSYPIPDHGALWYLCENGSCRAPVTDFSELKLV